MLLEKNRNTVLKGHKELNRWTAFIICSNGNIPILTITV